MWFPSPPPQKKKKKPIPFQNEFRKLTTLDSGQLREEAGSHCPSSGLSAPPTTMSGQFDIQVDQGYLRSHRWCTHSRRQVMMAGRDSANSIPEVGTRAGFSLMTGFPFGFREMAKWIGM